MAYDHPESLEYQMESVKNLYSELFMLMLESVTEDPQAPGAGRVDGAIDSLMHTIDDTMDEFLGTVRTARADRALSPALDGEIVQFEQQLKEGLTAMHGKVQTRMAELAQERDALKHQLQMIQRKRSGARGYRKGFVVKMAASDGEPLRASA